MRSLRLVACILMACGLGITGCHHNDNQPDGGQSPDGGPTDGGVTDGGTALQVTDLARDLILNHSNDAFPTTTEDKTFAPDSMDPKAFPASFFP